MYHGISNVTGRAHPYFETNTSPTEFARHMQHLRDWGYRPVGLDDAVRIINSGERQGKLVSITFDDGFRDFYVHAMPILQEYGFPATMFVVSGFIGARESCFDGKEFMTWHEVREIESLGVQIGSHTVSHPELRRLHLEGIERELRDSKQAIEDHLGKPIRSFSYPYAFPEQSKAFVRLLRDALSSAGYNNGVSTILGSANERSDPYFLPRLPANSYDEASLFQAKLEGAYDWLHTPQLVYKCIRGRRNVPIGSREAPRRTPEVVTEL